MNGTRHGSATVEFPSDREVLVKDQATRDSTKWTAADGVHADEGGQVSLDRLECYLAAGTAAPCLPALVEVVRVELTSEADTHA